MRRRAAYIYDHEARELPKRLMRDFHARHDLAHTTPHVHLDHDSCLEVTVLKGRGADLQQFAGGIIAERGVRHGYVVYLPADGSHTHGRGETHSHGHGHKQRKAGRPRQTSKAELVAALAALKHVDKYLVERRLASDQPLLVRVADQRFEIHRILPP